MSDHAALIADLQDLATLVPCRTRLGREFNVQLDVLMRARWHAQNAKIARALGGKIRSRRFPHAGQGRHYGLVDHAAYVWKDGRGLAVISHAYVVSKLPRYELTDGWIARRLNLESAWNPGCAVYVLMAGDAPEWREALT